MGRFDHEEFQRRLPRDRTLRSLLIAREDDPRCPWPRNLKDPQRRLGADSFLGRRFKKLEGAEFPCDEDAARPHENQEALELLAYVLSEEGGIPTTARDLFTETFVRVEVLDAALADRDEVQAKLDQKNAEDEPDIARALEALGRPEMLGAVSALYASLDLESAERRDLAYVLGKAGKLRDDERVTTRSLPRAVGICGVGSDDDVRNVLRNVAGAANRLRAEGVYVILVPLRLDRPDCVAERLSRWANDTGALGLDTVWWRLATVDGPRGPFDDDAPPDLRGIMSVGLEDRPTWGEHFAERRPWLPILYDGLAGSEMLKPARLRLSPLSDALSVHLRRELEKPYPPHSVDRAQALFRIMRNIATFQPLGDGPAERLEAVERWIGNLAEEKPRIVMGLLDLAWEEVPDGPLKHGFEPFYQALVPALDNHLHNRRVRLENRAVDLFEPFYRELLRSPQGTELLAVSHPRRSYLWNRKVLSATRAFIRNTGVVRRIFLLRADEIDEEAEEIMRDHAEAGVEVFTASAGYDDVPDEFFIVDRAGGFGWRTLCNAAYQITQVNFFRDADFEAYIDKWDQLLERARPWDGG